MVNKHVCSVFLLNKSKAFSVIEPLYRSITHNNILLSKKFQCLKLEDAIQRKKYLQKETVLKMESGLH